MKKSKKYVEASKKVEKNTLYTKEDAIKLVKETATTKFDSTVEVAIKLNLDTKKADQQLRGSLVLPNGTGKTKKVLVIAKGEAAQKAKDAGADYVGDMDTVTMNTAKAVEDIKKGMITYKTDSYGNVHSIIGKVSFDDAKLLENLVYVVNTIVKAKPQTVKGNYIENISISSTMGPGIKLDKNSFEN